MKTRLAAVLATSTWLGACAAPAPEPEPKEEAVASQTQRIEEPTLVGNVHEDVLAYPKNEEEESTGLKFGYALDIAGDTALIGEYDRLVNGVRSGAAFVYRHGPGGWSDAEGPLVPPEVVDDQQFGWSVSLSEGFLVVGSSNEVEPKPVWIQDRATKQWSRLDPPDGSTETFGAAVELTDTELFVADPLAEDNAGVVRCYRQQKDGSWLAGDPLRPQAGFGLGFGISLALEDNLLAIGSPYEDGGGAAYLFTRTSSDASWDAGKRLQVPAGSSSFGSSVALSADGVWLAVGDYTANSEAGIVQLYSSNDGWTAPQPLALDTIMPAPNAWFGSQLAFAKGVLCVSAPETGLAGNPTGLIQTFQIVDDAWTPAGKIYPEKGQPGGHFGRAFASSRAGTILSAASPKVYSFTSTLGVPCTTGAECESGYCTDGVCCNSACADLCYSCLAANTTAKQGKDGECLPADVETDPDDECASSTDACKSTGVCDGRGKCQLARAGLTCGEASCLTTTKLVGLSTCDGLGECVAPDPVSCKAGFSCEDGKCRGQQVEVTTCAQSADCDEESGLYCLEGNCVSGQHCSREREAAFDGHGNRTECQNNLLCRAGECPESCTATKDCAGDFICHPRTHECVPESVLQGPGGLSSCEMRGNADDSGRLFPAAVLGLMLLRRRAARRQCDLEKNR